MSIELTIIVRLLLAVILGAGLGYQRELSGKPAGLRTHALISMGAALFTIISIFGFDGQGDPSRIAAGVVTGIGFLGAGVIFRSMRGDVQVGGLTTAASVWAVAAIGMAAGAGLYLVAVIVALIVVVVLIIPKVKG